MSLEFHQFIFYAWLYLLSSEKSTTGMTLTVIPSNDVAVNQNVTLQCELDSNPPSPIVVSFRVTSSNTTLCQLQPITGVCKNTIPLFLCSFLYKFNASCPSTTRYNIQVTVPSSWNNVSVICHTRYRQSNRVLFFVRDKPEVRSISTSPYRVREGQTATLECTVTDANPSIGITWRWIKTDSPYIILHNGPTYTIPHIQRGGSGSYNCTASNIVGTSEPATVYLDVQYKPNVRSRAPSPYRVIEGETAALMCTVSDANPNIGITWRWFKTDSPNTGLSYGPNYTIPNIQRGRSGSYSCTASNTVGTSEAATADINVQYKPDVRSTLPSPFKVIEGQTATLECTVTAANPNTVITWRWFKTDSPNNVLHNGPSYTIPNIQRGRSGSYNCTASNTVGTSEAATVNVNVQYKPEVRPTLLNPYKVREGETVTLLCTLTSANPNTGITWKWIKTENPNTVLHNETFYTISNIKRESVGSYNCTASNILGTSKPALVEVDVLYGPSITIQTVEIVNETEKAVLTAEVISNPLSNVSWYRGSNLLKYENSVNTTNLIIEKARCTDTRNFTLTASNTVRVNVTSSVQLIVNCKPVSEVNNITHEVSDDTGIVFSTTVIAYPKPLYALLYENGAKTHDILDRIVVNAINNFTIHFEKTVFEQADYGFYRLYINNTFGETIIYVNVIPQRKPYSPRNVGIICRERSATIQWTSSFNGGDPQMFKAMAFLAQKVVSYSESVPDSGQDIVHRTQLQNLEPSTTYAFYIVAKNKHGNSSSEKRDCKTSQESRNQTPLVAGSTVGTLGLVTLIIVAVIIFQRRYTCIRRLEKTKIFKDNEEKDESPHCSTIKEQETAERNVYDELTPYESEYESVLMKDLEVDETKTYEKLPKLEDDETNVLPAKGSSKPLQGPSTQETTSCTEYMNTSFRK
uniref:Hemicentin-1-like isoform X2 n=1 Tax=Crassostrea virginica TaxID=6565 RepID=A0A8B8AE44_CRAVI|nr:hemicentin-1-like isoform X2 [Crassostrea virginica]